MANHAEDTIRDVLSKHDKLLDHICDIVRTHENALLIHDKMLQIFGIGARVAFLISLVSLAASLIALALTIHALTIQ